MVRFDPADAVSVPEDCSCQKLRVAMYEIIQEIEIEDDSEITKPYYAVYTVGSATEYDDDYHDDDYYDDGEYTD